MSPTSNGNGATSPAAGSLPAAVERALADQRAVVLVEGKRAHYSYDKATRDRDELRRRLAQFPSSTNAGGVPGLASPRQLGLDLDGPKAIAEAERRGWMGEPTPMVRSSPGRLHRYYLHPGGEVGNFVLWADPHWDGVGKPQRIEIRADGGYLVLPGSIHPDTSLPYEWVPDYAPGEVAYLEVTGSLLEAIRAKQSEAHDEVRAANGARSDAGGADSPPAFADDALLAVACGARNGAKVQQLLDGDTAGYASASEADLALCCCLAFFTRDAAQIDRLFRRSKLMRTKWDRGDYAERTIARAVEQAGVKHVAGEAMPEPWDELIPLTEYPVPAFPTACLPDAVRDYVQAEAEAAQVPPGMVASVALGALAAACAKRAVVRVKPGFEEPLNLYFLSVNPSGERKTVVLRKAGKPLYDRQEDLLQQYRLTIGPLRSELRVAEKRLAKAESVAASDGSSPTLRQDCEAVADAEAKIPPEPVLVTEDVTPEKVASLLAEHGRLAILSAEGGGLFAIVRGKYSKGGESSYDVFLKGHSGDAMPVHRMGRPSSWVRDPALTVVLAVQPVSLTGLMADQEARGRGFCARFLFDYPAPRIGHRRREVTETPTEIRERYERVLLALLARPALVEETGAPAPLPVLQLSSEAAACLYTYWDELEPRFRDEEGDLIGLRDWGGKLIGHIARLAGVMHMAEHAIMVDPAHTPISGATMMAAVDLGKYYLLHALKSFAMMEADEVLERAKRVLAWIRRQPSREWTAADCYRSLREQRWCQHPDDLQPALGKLVRHGYIRPIKAESRPGRPTARYATRPVLPQ